ncbi:MAG: hypothetical protein ACREMU_03160 [Gemmatimonadaceae bacterium]
MTPIPSAALSVAGFALAHAAWSLSDGEDGDLLCPLAVIEQRDGARRLMRFEADTQEDAIIAGKAAMREASVSSAAWAFAREGAWRAMGGDGAGDVLAIDLWAADMAGVATLMQPFERARRGARFRIAGVPKIVVGDRLLERDAAATIVEGIVAGVSAHAIVAKLWPTWR